LFKIVEVPQSDIPTTRGGRMTGDKFIASRAIYVETKALQGREYTD
jgi:hypothetical protein